MTERHHKPPTPRATRRGTAYVMTLTVCSVAATTAVAGLAIRAASADRGERIADLAEARILAQTGIEATLQRIEDDVDWRGTFGAQLIDSVSVGDGRFQIAVFDPADNNLEDDPEEAYRLISRGETGNAAATLSVDIRPLSTTYRERVIDESPLRYWPLDETSGSTADDLMDNDNAGHSGSGTLNKLTGFDGRPAPLYDSTFENSWDMHHDDLLVDKVTVMCWVYCLGNTAGEQTVFAKSRENRDSGEFKISLVGDSLDLTASLTDGGRNRHTLSLGRMPTGTWTHVAVSFGDHGFFGYVNGSLVDSNKSLTIGWQSPANRDTVLIGAQWTGLFPKESLNGSVRDLAIFDKQLNEGDITNLVEGPVNAFAIDPDSWAWVVN